MSKKLQHNRPARSAGQKRLYTNNRLPIFSYFANLLNECNLSKNMIIYVGNVWFKVQSVVHFDTKDFDFVSRIQIVVMNRKGEWPSRRF